MSDKEKNPDFHLEIDEDDLELTLDDEVFQEKESSENDDLLTEEELENLIIGIDEENDILDIPDEEEVLEELKFFDENFSLPEKGEKTMEPEKVEEKNGNSEEKNKKVKKEKPKKEKKPKPPREPFDFQYFLVKNKFKLIGLFVVFIIIIFTVTFLLVLKKNPKAEETEKINTSTEHTMVTEEEPKEALTEEEIAINSLKEELAIEKDEEKRLLLQDAIIELEGKKVAKVREEKLVKLQEALKESSATLNSSLFKVEEDVLIMAFVLEKEEYAEELYKIISKVFEDEYQINKLSITILSKGEKIKNLGQITVDINKFKEISEKNITTQEKLKLMNFENRMKE